MSSVDERVVDMKFNNSQFQSGIASTLTSLDSLKKGLNLDSATKSVNDLDSAGKKFSLEGMAKGVDAMASKFGALGIAGITAIANITNRVVDAGIQLGKSILTDPIRDGFNEYELKMGSIQTILANTSKDGTKLDDVAKSLDDLNAYADKTIYNFGDMTRNIGLFTNAGIKLQDATDMIKGFSNEAAASGTNATQASGAAYQLSQALSKGKVTLEDWRSLTNAGMGNKNMQNGLIDIAKAMGVFSKTGQDSKKVAEDFNGSLEKGWLTADVMQNYLKIQAGELSAEQMKTLGLSDEQITAFQKQQKIAEEAATKVRTWTQLIDTLKEAVGSSWATTAELLLGDFDEATTLFTGINNAIGPMIGAMGDARNKLIKEWVDAGGRASAYNSIKNVFDAIVAVVKPVIAAFREIFPPTTGAQIAHITKIIEGFTKALIPSAENVDRIKRTFKGLFAILDIGWNIIQIVGGLIGDMFGQFKGGPSTLLEVTARIGDFLVRLRDMWQASEGVVPVVQFLQKVIKGIGEVARYVVGILAALVAGIASIGKTGAEGALSNLQRRLQPLGDIGETVKKVFEKLTPILQKVVDFFRPMAQTIGTTFKTLASGISEAFKNADYGAIGTLLSAGMMGGIYVGIKKVLKSFDAKEIGGGFLEHINGIFEGLTGTLGAMQAQLKAGTLMKIATAIGVLTISVVALSLIDSNKLAGALAALTTMFLQLGGALIMFEKIAAGSGFVKLPFIAVGLILLAVAIDLLTIAVANLARLNWKQLVKGLGGVGILLGELALAVKLMSGSTGNFIAIGIGLTILAVGVNILVGAVEKLGHMDVKSLMKGLGSVGVVLAELTLFTKFAQANKGAMTQSVGLILLAVAIGMLADSVQQFANLNVKELIKGLGAMGIVIAELAVFTKMASGSTGMITTAAGLVVLAFAMGMLQGVVASFGDMSVKELAKGLIAMAGSLVIIGIAMNMMPGNMLISAAALVVVAYALGIITEAVKSMAGMSWEEIGKGMVVLAGSLIILALAMAAMQELIVGAAALMVVSVALSMLAPAMVALGGMSWEQIGAGLAMLAATLAVLGLAGLVLTPVIPTLLGLGVAITLLGIGALAVGAGLFLFAAGLTALSVAGAAGTAALVILVQGLLGLIPYAMEQFGLGIQAFANVIAQSGPQFFSAMVTLISSLLNAIDVIAPQIVATLINLIWLLLSTLANNVQRFVEAGLSIVTGFLRGIANKLGDVISAAVDVVVAFINGVANNLGKVIEAGVNLILKFVNGISDAIDNHAEEMGRAGGRLAGSIVKGMVNGISAGIREVIDAAVNLGRGALDAAKDILGIHSPSREFHKVGAWSSQGMAEGLTATADVVGKAAEGVGTTAMTSLQNSLANLSDAVAINIDSDPVIKPVLDLTAIKKDSSLISGMLTPSALAVDSSYGKAAYLSNKMTSMTQVSPEDGTAQASGPQLTLVQNNYSPKALSPAEIYRNTKNQLSVAKGAMTP